MNIGDKVNYIKRQKQSRSHRCHWPGCEARVPPALWGCRKHWYSLPRDLRQRVWQTYKPGQEKSLNPSREYVRVAKDIQEWIKSHA